MTRSANTTPKKPVKKQQAKAPKTPQPSTNISPKLSPAFVTKLEALEQASTISLLTKFIAISAAVFYYGPCSYP